MTRHEENEYKREFKYNNWVLKVVGYCIIAFALISLLGQMGVFYYANH